MNKIQVIKGLAALALVTASATASAVQVYLVQNGYHSASSGGAGAFWDNASSATWDWNSSTGILTETGGTLNMTRRSPAANPAGTPLYTDVLQGLVIDTGADTATASAYTCIEGSFGSFTGGSICGNYSWGFNNANDSTIAYNFGGAADCVNIVTGGDDGVPSGPPPATAGGTRGLTEHAASGSCAGTIGAYDQTHILSDTTGTGGTLTLWNAIGDGTHGSIAGVSTQCVGYTLAGPNYSSTACNGAHWMTFSAVPVPGAAWLFTSALGVVGWARRRTRQVA